MDRVPPDRLKSSHLKHRAGNVTAKPRSLGVLGRWSRTRLLGRCIRSCSGEATVVLSTKQENFVVALYHIEQGRIRAAQGCSEWCNLRRKERFGAGFSKRRMSPWPEPTSNVHDWRRVFRVAGDRFFPVCLDDAPSIEPRISDLSARPGAHL